MLQLMDMLAQNGYTIRARRSLQIYTEALLDAPDGQRKPGGSGPGRG